MFNRLVEKARGGDEDALAEIIERLQPLLIASIRRYYNRPKEYEDLIQDGNLKIIQSLGEYDPNRGVYFLGYIKMKIKHLYLDKHKERHHGSLNEKLGDGGTEAIDLLVGEEVDFLGNIVREEDREKVLRLLELLTPRQRQVITMFYGREMTLDQIAEELGVAYRTVVNIKARALEKMRKIKFKGDDL